MAYGPAFRQQTSVDPFDSIELYNLFAREYRLQVIPFS